MRSFSKFRIVLCLSLFLLILSPFSVHADIVVPYTVDNTFFNHTGVAIGPYDGNPSINVYIDPSHTNWMAISNSNSLIQAGIGSYLGGGNWSLPYGSPGNTHPQINQSGMDDYLILTVSKGTQSATARLDDNDAVNHRIGNQAVFFGTYGYVRAVDPAYPSIYVDLASETGALNSFFNTNGAGTYTFALAYYNEYTDAAAHNPEYLLVDVNPPPVGAPEPATMLLLGLGLVGLAGVRRKFHK